MTSSNTDLSKPTCRVCLQNCKEEEMSSIFDLDKDFSDLHIFEKIEFCAGIKIIRHNKIPNLICGDCYGVLKVSYKFRTICRNSDEYLNEFIVNKENESQTEELSPKQNTQLITEKTADKRGLRSHQQLRLKEKTAAPPLSQHNEEENTQTFKIKKTISPNLSTNSEALNDVNCDNNEKDDDVEEEMWLDADYQEDDVGFSVESLEEKSVEINETDEQNEISTVNIKKSISKPSKTLGITSDGAAIIREKEPRAKRDKHEKQHHICDVCGNIYQRRYTLEVHMRRHSNEKPFECEICGHAFHSNFELIRHMRKHTGSRPYKCNYCARAFGDQSTLIKHERIHRNERPFKCETCGKSFTYSNVLKYHMYTHTGEKPYTCELCGKCFTRQHHLRAHLETLQHQNDAKAKILLQNLN